MQQLESQMSKERETRGREGAQPLKEWHPSRGYDINWLESSRSKTEEGSTSSRPWALYTLIVIHCCCLVAKSCLTLCDPMDCRPPGSSVHGTCQARVLEWVAISFSRGIFPTQLFCIIGGSLPFEPPGKIIHYHKLNDTPTGALTVPRLIIKGQKVGRGPIPGNLHSFSELVGTILPLISLWNFPAHRTNHPISQSLWPSEMAHTLWNVFLRGLFLPFRWTEFCLWNVYLSQ